MKYLVKEIRWHGASERIMSIDICGDLLVTAGADITHCEWIRFWRVSNNPLDVSYLFSADIRHELAVNVVRFSP